MMVCADNSVAWTCFSGPNKTRNVRIGKGDPPILTRVKVPIVFPSAMLWLLYQIWTRGFLAFSTDACRLRVFCETFHIRQAAIAEITDASAVTQFDKSLIC